MSKLKTRFETHRNYHVQGCSEFVRCPKNMIRLNTHNSLKHELEKVKICFEIQNHKEQFITEACRNDNGDIVDLVNLDTGEEWEIINTHGLEKAINNGRSIVKI